MTNDPGKEPAAINGENANVYMLCFWKSVLSIHG